jgi:hypothetical protein
VDTATLKCLCFVPLSFSFGKLLRAWISFPDANGGGMFLSEALTFTDEPTFCSQAALREPTPARMFLGHDRCRSVMYAGGLAIDVLLRPIRSRSRM